LSNDACVIDDGAFAKKAIDPNSFGAGEVVTPASLPVSPEEKSLSILDVSIRQWR
jgi:hypothetical protein